MLLLARRVRRLVKERQRFSGGQRDVEHVEYRRDGGVAPGGVMSALKAAQGPYAPRSARLMTRCSCVCEWWRRVTSRLAWLCLGVCAVHPIVMHKSDIN